MDICQDSVMKVVWTEYLWWENCLNSEVLGSKFVWIESYQVTQLS